MGTERVTRSIRNIQRLLLVFPLLVLAGCASLPVQAPVSAGDIAWVLAGADMLPAQGSAVLEAPDSLLHVTEEMHQFARNATRGRSSAAGMANALTAAMGAENGLHLQYDADATLTAEQAFSQRRVNCLTYTLLFVALARDIGLRATFNEVDIPPVWDLGDDQTSLLYKHVNARIDVAGPLFLIVDVNGDDYDPNYAQRDISDAEIEAQFYNNRAVELRLQQHHDQALRYQLRALELSPDTAYLWTNLASLYLLDGSLRAARIAVTRSLTLDSYSMMGYETAASVYEQLGKSTLAADFRERTQYFRDQNPYYHYQLALAAFSQHDESLAYREARRAIQLYSRDSRFFFLQAVVLNQLGETRQANDSMQAAIGLTTNAAQQERYRSKFARLSKHG
ncbi:MAG: hypothetical protein ACRETW_05100 [Stenotrophobium sp.]